ncbi:MAG: response regulator [Steroidobacteraceae bacterium]
MSARRALVVDDSKSARIVLSRMLEKYGLEVDSAESAEQALDYLKTHRPDVIFMDHMMPGMDGLQAVQQIKTDTSTASIPVMMYTSQEGELYVGQARALGAVGVLPKTVRPVDVTKVLYQLRLLPDRRDTGPSVFQSVEAPAAAGSAPAGPAAPDADGAPAVGALKAQIEKLLHDQTIELRRFFMATIDSSAQRITAELRPREPEPPAVPVAAEPPPVVRPWGWIATAVMSLLALLVVSFLYWQSLETARDVEAARVRLEQESGALRAMLEQVREAVRANARSATTAGGRVGEPAVLHVPYGENPLAPARIESLRALFTELGQRDFRGVVRIELHSGEFCLSEVAGGGYALADPAVPVSKCAQVGNPHVESLGANDRQPLAFANLIASVGSESHGRIQATLVDRGKQEPAVDYPAGDSALAGDWNRAAVANNRVAIVVTAR